MTRKLLAPLFAGLLALAMLAGPVAAHPQDPPGEGDGVGAVPAEGPGHAGIQCAHVAGAPPFPDGIDVECPAADEDAEPEE